ncbi:MAG: GFA family protein [Cyanophyceae cyanobacterium]
MALGSCNCGGVTFKVEKSLSDVYLCHCSICRKATGAAGIEVVVVPKHLFWWTAGETLITHWAKPGHDWQMNFCRICGSPLPGDNDEANVFIPVGFLSDGTKNLKVAHHIWVGSKAIWDDVGESGVQHLEALDQ